MTIIFQKLQNTNCRAVTYIVVKGQVNLEPIPHCVIGRCSYQLSYQGSSAG